MEVVKANATDAAFEKHVPNYEIKDDEIIVEVNHVMEEDHYIEWIAFISEKKEEYVYFNPGEDCRATFKNAKGILYSYCNKHSLWMKKIECS